MNNLNKTKAFTLVELIVVIVILAILATIAFLSFGNQASSARDSIRVSDLSTLSKGLGVKVITLSTFPMPDDSVELNNGTGVLGYQGSAGQNIWRILQASQDGFLDPLDKVPYLYAINKSKSKYELLAFLENGNSIAYNFNATDIATLKATGYINRYPYTKGDALGIILNSTGGKLTPINDYLRTNSLTGIDLATAGSGIIAYVNNSSGQINASDVGFLLNSYIGQPITLGTPVETGTGTENCLGSMPANASVTAGSTGSSLATWSYSLTPGLCKYSCDTSFHAENSGSTCVSDTRTCTPTGGSGNQTWNAGAGNWDACVATSCDLGYYLNAGACLTYVDGDCINLPVNGLFKNNDVDYTLVSAPNSTSLDALTAGYNATPTNNTCQWKCSTGYSHIGNTCSCSSVNPNDYFAACNICPGVNAVGWKCNGGIVVNNTDNSGLITTPGGCTNSTTPTCPGGVDSLMLTWDKGGGPVGPAKLTVFAADGLASTNTLFASSNSWAPYKAAGYCHEMDYNSKTDWYLPSINEIGYIGVNRALIQGYKASSAYFSSTQDNTPYVQTMSMSVAGGPSYSQTTQANIAYIRCMRRF